MLKLRTLNRRSQKGAQPEIFQDRGDFIELRHFDNHFVKTENMAPQVKIWVSFSEIPLKLHFEWKI